MKIKLTFCLLSMAMSAYAGSLDVKNLIKVDKNQKQACVEYYLYQNELYCSTKSLGYSTISADTLAHEKQKIFFDQRVWVPVWGKTTDNITSIEYISSQDTIDHWQELVTSQFIPNLQEKISLKDYFNSMMDQLKKVVPEVKIQLIEETPDQIIFEFQIAHPTQLQQDELQKIIKGKDGFYVLHYVIKRGDMGTDKRTQWLKNLKASHPK